ncbi:hypothetical protein ACC713_37815, partial [Rhizobium johnstonii]|uniref:hypothetical protein n=1 Tax=Rhizobium johnstonii TaxID=3019933 RepID=UPI003F9BC992
VEPLADDDIRIGIVENVVRGYLAGTTGTSILTLYKKGERECLPLASTAPSEPALLSWRPFALFACGVAASAAGLRPDVA